MIATNLSTNLSVGHADDYNGNVAKKTAQRLAALVAAARADVGLG